LLTRQLEDGSWPEALDRPPAQGSLFTVTALALEGINHYATNAQRKLADAALKKGRGWLRYAKPVTTEDWAFYIRGLAFVGAKDERIAAARQELLKKQVWRSGRTSSCGNPSFSGEVRLARRHTARIGNDLIPIWAYFHPPRLHTELTCEVRTAPRRRLRH
jgi:hypothetical protein